MSRASCGAGCSPRTRCLHQALPANVGRITPATATHVMKRRTGTKTNPESAASPAEVCSEEHDCSTESRERSEARLLQPGCATPQPPGASGAAAGSGNEPQSVREGEEIKISDLSRELPQKRGKDTLREGSRTIASTLLCEKRQSS